MGEVVGITKRPNSQALGFVLSPTGERIGALAPQPDGSYLVLVRAGSAISTAEGIDRVRRAYEARKALDDAGV